MKLEITAVTLKNTDILGSIFKLCNKYLQKTKMFYDGFFTPPILILSNVVTSLK